MCQKSKIPPQILWKISAVSLLPLYRKRHNLFRPTNANVLGAANPPILLSELDAGKILRENFSQCKRVFQNTVPAHGVPFVLPYRDKNKRNTIAKAELGILNFQFNYLFFKVTPFTL